MKDFCIICHSFFSSTEIIESQLKHCCSTCADKIFLNRLTHPISNTSSFPLSDDSPLDNTYSIFYYQHLIRDLILRAKVQKDYQALQLLLSIVEKELPSIKSFISSHVGTNLKLSLIPTPSSLWSRFKGKYDVAYLITQTLSKELKVPIEKTSYKLGWSLFKRSKNKIKYTPDSISSTVSRTDTSIQTFDFNRCILIVDDILTTGQTLKNLGSIYQSPNTLVLYFTLATSKSFFTHI